MTLWRLEWLRLLRTRRWVALLGVYLFFGITGPLSARYIGEILGQVSTPGVRVEVQPPTPADGLSQYVSNASQLGLLTVVIVAASALAFDSRREMAIFLRTRVTSVRAIVLPAYTVNVVAATACMVLGTLTAWYETVLLLGQLPAGAILVGLVLGAVYLAATVAVVALVASLAPSLLATAGISLAILIGMVIVGGLGNVGSYLPTNLAGAMIGLARGASATTYLPATGISIVLIGAALAGAVHFGARREL